ncbi:ATP-binding/permease protein CydD [Aggregatibacter aphrophilus]|uniref:ATP-binding/permease protein CydD n=1 Tax=Aggregatibacter aphrophilus TaxID=732 RepID=A0A336NBK4_AGGAP|nr:ATP-binding/permease protein CydD [Aggregatibacter aphrophilus]
MATLARLSGQFLDRLRGLETLRLFDRTSEQTRHIEESTEDFRETTMDVLKMAFLSSAVLEFLRLFPSRLWLCISVSAI